MSEEYSGINKTKKRSNRSNSLASILENDLGLIKESKPMLYSIMNLKSYDRERHIAVDSAYNLIESQNDDYLPLDKLKQAVQNREIRVYNFRGQNYLDRLDIGRVYHKEPEKKEGLTIDRYFTDGKINPFDTTEYDQKNVEIKDVEGNIIFEMNNAVFPKSWDSTSASIVAQKYFYKPDKPEWKQRLKDRIGSEYENSIEHLITRVTNYFVEWGGKLGYFRTEEDKKAFADELKWLQLHRKFAFNSPVQFNAGIFSEYGIEGSRGINYWRNPVDGRVIKIDKGNNVRPQCHACFINGPTDNLESIATHVINEIGIFSSGSGIGQNIGALREEGSPLSGGGKASGPMSFFKVYDAVAGTIKSGGKSRRAARMTTMRYEHPDIEKFVISKMNEDKKALILMQNGFSGTMDGEAFTTVAYQNTNISVRLDDHFFEQVKNDGQIDLKRITDSKTIKRISARRLLQEISVGSWRVGDPGVQYESIIQLMHTCKNSGRQNSSNPCSEYLFLNDSACNLASANVLAFTDEKGKFDAESYQKAIRLIAIAQDIQNDAASYPVKEIAMISPEYRTIGTGYANIGAFLMRNGIAYDSDEGRAFVAAITALTTGTVYSASAEIAEKLGTFTHFEFNKKPMMDVMEIHKKSLDDVIWKYVDDNLKKAAYKSWENVIKEGNEHGFRNAQATVIAPTGTISFLMGCDTTGIEPAISLKIKKDLAGGGSLYLCNSEVPNTLKNLGYTMEQIEDVSKYVDKYNTVRGAPHLTPEHYSIFDTAYGNESGTGSISFEGHIKMLGATQPFVSGAISKTNNLPESSTVKDIYDGFMLGYEEKLKALSIFRNNSKPISALNFGDKNHHVLKRGEKEELISRRPAFETEVEIDGQPLHVIVSDYPDGRPGQIVFLSYTAGSTLKALLETHGILASKSLKRGVDLEDVVAGWIGQKFEPNGLVSGHPHIKTALSPLDFAGKFLLLEYKGMTEYAESVKNMNKNELWGAKNGAFRTYKRAKVDAWDVNQILNDDEYGGFTDEELDADKGIKNKPGNNRGVTCKNCGNIMIPTAPNCYSCTNCGEKVGGCGQ